MAAMKAWIERPGRLALKELPAPEIDGAQVSARAGAVCICKGSGPADPG